VRLFHTKVQLIENLSGAVMGEKSAEWIAARRSGRAAQRPSTGGGAAVLAAGADFGGVQ